MDPPGGDPAPVPRAGRPRMFGGVLDPKMLPWPWAVERLTSARQYWIATTRANGRPHARPVWGVWLGASCYFSTGSLAAENLARSPEISVHVERGDDVVIVEGLAAQVADRAAVERVVAAYNAKYRWDLDPDSLPDPFYEVRPRVVFGWASDNSGLDGGAHFHGSVTRWTFPTPESPMSGSGGSTEVSR